MVLIDRITKAEGTKSAQLVEHYGEEPAKQDVTVKDLAVITEFKDGIVPDIIETG